MSEAKMLNGAAPPSLPPKIAAAICEVMKEIPKLEKGEKNTHGDYNFTSIDDFLEAVRPLCANKGLVIITDEESFDIRQSEDGKSVWLVISYAFTLSHSGGETWAHRPRRTIMVNAKMGSQAFGAAQSYVLKQFMRALFQIATGEVDQDADSHPQSNLPHKAPAKKREAPRVVQGTERRELPPVVGTSPEAPQEPQESPRKVITIQRLEGGGREFPATNAGALEALSDLEALCAVNRDAWELNKSMILLMAQVSKNQTVKDRALALETAMNEPVPEDEDQPVLMP